MAVTVCHGKNWVEDGFGFFPLGETGEGLYWSSPCPLHEGEGSRVPLHGGVSI